MNLLLSWLSMAYHIILAWHGMAWHVMAWHVIYFIHRITLLSLIVSFRIILPSSKYKSLSFSSMERRPRGRYHTQTTSSKV